MRNISDFINENINEGTMDNIILQNLAEISDNDIVIGHVGHVCFEK